MRLEAKNSFDRTFYVVEHNQGLGVIDTLWYGYASQQDLKNACGLGLEVLEKSTCAYKLNDNSQLSGPWSDAVGWLEKEWLPRAMQAGLRYLAHVANRHSYGEVAGEVLRISQIGEQLEYCMFYSREEALAWLKSCQERDRKTALSYSAK
ncbi:hypothetical protein [Rufibacter quisquiliarum]|uniref:STAS/SEC14 domain-containing protein n=1 Tax=Rufibacter quisquiliarum TaxID=1549639 RepID=A0A839GJ30_9BACT|nr:hypothetical protein [Rufibacter quisquiliarum]MBA9076759.1 hypothetical protein [Rufibacter quisquiliarum]